MAQLVFCQITELNKDYKNVYDFNSREEQLNFMRSRSFIGIESNVKIDCFTSSVTIPIFTEGGQTLTKMKSCDYLYTRMINGDYLFFFIDSLELVTSSTVKLYLTLDVWQTYHLDIQLKPSYVIRQHVPRWNADGTPTKEIVSEEFPQYEYTYTTQQTIKNINQGSYIYVASSPLGLISDSTSGGGGDVPPKPEGGCGNQELGIPTPNGFKFIKGFEGLAQYGHDIGDGAGETIGYGTTQVHDAETFAILKANEPVSDELASQYYAESLVSNYGLLLRNQLVSDNTTVTNTEFDALLSFVYNAGLGSYQRSNIRTCLLNGDKNGAYNAWLTQNILEGSQYEQGLRARRQAEANIFLNGKYEIRNITVYGQGGAVIGSINADDSSVPSLISNECQSGVSTIDIEDELGYTYMFPVESGRFTNVYPNYNDGTYHGAVDLSGNDNKPIYAPRNNMKVIKVVGGYPNERNDSIGYGNYVVLEDLSTGLRSWYGHMRATPEVFEGDTVGVDSVLGYVGTSGFSTGAHLHYEIRQSPYTSSDRINPIKYIYTSDGNKHQPSISETFTRGQGKQN